MMFVCVCDGCFLILSVLSYNRSFDSSPNVYLSDSRTDIGSVDDRLYRQ